MKVLLLLISQRNELWFRNVRQLPDRAGVPQPESNCPKTQGINQYSFILDIHVYPIFLQQNVTAVSTDVFLSKPNWGKKILKLPIGVHVGKNIRQSSIRKFKRKALINWAGDISYFQTIKSMTYFPCAANYLRDLSTGGRPNLHK